MKDNLNAFIKYLEKELNYSDLTIKNYELDITHFCNYLTSNNINYLHLSKNDVREYLKKLSDDDLSSKSISRKISALRSFYSFLVSVYALKENVFDLITNPKLEKKLPNYLNSEEVENLLQSFSVTDFFSSRNHLIIELIYSCGFRLSEVVNIEIKNINFDEKKIKIMGKGKKERIVLFGDVAKEALINYLDKYRSNYAMDLKYLFISKTGSKLSVSMVEKIIKKQAQTAGIKHSVSAHNLRHTFATDLLNSGASVETVQNLLGHSSLSTTQIYTHVTSEKIKSTYLKAHPRSERD